MEKALRIVILSLVIIALILFICTAFFNFNPVTEIKRMVIEHRNQANINYTIIDNKTLKIDNPPFAFDRFNNIFYNGFRYEENETTDFIVINFTDNSGYLNDKHFQLELVGMIEDKIICEVGTNKTAGELYCDIYNYIQNSEQGRLMLIFYATGGGQYKPLDSTEINKQLADMIIKNAENKCSEGYTNYCNR